MASIDKRLDRALPAKPTKGGVTAVPDEDLREAVAALREHNTSAKWRW